MPVATAFLGTRGSSSGNGEIMDGRSYYRNGLEKLHDQVIGRMGRCDSMGACSTSHAHVVGSSGSRDCNQSTVMLTANVGFLAIPGVVLSNLSGSSISGANQVFIFTSSSQIASSLSVEASIGSIVTGLLLARHNRTKQKEDPAGAVSTQSSLTRSPS